MQKKKKKTTHVDTHTSVVTTSLSENCGMSLKRCRVLDESGDRDHRPPLSRLTLSLSLSVICLHHVIIFCFTHLLLIVY